jgi:hypothetical protein
LLIAIDGDEAFVMEAVEAVYYELVAASAEEVVQIERAGYRLLRRAPDFEWVAESADWSGPLGPHRC